MDAVVADLQARFECEPLELVPSVRIVLRWGFVGPDRLAGPTFHSRLTVTLREAPDAATELLTPVHERPDDLREARPDIAEGVGPGLEMALDKLAALAQAEAGGDSSTIEGGNTR